jgi:hypothetical protein
MTMCERLGKIFDGEATIQVITFLFEIDLFNSLSFAFTTQRSCQKPPFTDSRSENSFRRDHVAGLVS